MLFWVWLIGAVLVAIGVLDLADAYHANIPDWLMTAGVFGVAWSLVLFLLCVLAYVIIRLFCGRALTRVLGACLMFVSFGFLGVFVYQKHTAFEKMRPIKPVQVVATVEIGELSDSLYNPAHNQAYRQKARISDIRLVSAPKNTTTANPFYRSHADQALLQSKSQAAPLPNTMTVLLYAPPTKPNTYQANTQINQTTDPLAPLSALQVGDRVTMTLQLSPPVRDERLGFDGYRWLTSRHIHANARVVSVDGAVSRFESAGIDGVLLKIQAVREYYRSVFVSVSSTDNQQGMALILSLLTGDRALIDRRTTELYQYAGISHLLAISGTHVLFLALLMAGLMTRLLDLCALGVYRYVPRWQVRFLVMVAASLVYALFVGFEVPAVRTVVMLCAVGLARYLLLGWSSFRVLAVVFITMVLVDPFVLWQAGFWLSFVAVAVLIAYEMGRHTLRQTSDVSAEGYLPKWVRRGAQKVWAVMCLQGYMFLAMLPIGLLLFGRVSWLGALFNLGAVGLFGLVVVPINLLGGVVYVLSPALAMGLWQGLAWVLEGLSALIGTMQVLLGDTWITTPMSVAGVLLLMLGVGLWRGRLLLRRLCIVPFVAMALALFVPSSQVDRASLGALKGASSIYVQVLAGDERALSAVLIQSDKERWLIVSLKGVPHGDDEHLARHLSDGLARARVDTLSGVLIQNGDKQSRESLARAVGRISLNMSIRALYWSAEDTRFGQLHTRRCQAGESIVLNGQATLSVLTGWQAVYDEAMHTCNVLLQSDLPSQILSDGRGHDDARGLRVVAEQETTAILFDGANDPKLWQLYDLMCPPKQRARADVVLTHADSVLSSAQYEKFGASSVVFSHQLIDEKERLRAKQTYQNLTR